MPKTTACPLNPIISYINGGTMLTKTLKVTDRFIEIPCLERYRGKLVEITIKEKKKSTGKKI